MQKYILLLKFEIIKQSNQNRKIDFVFQNCNLSAIYPDNLLTKWQLAPSKKPNSHTFAGELKTEDIVSFLVNEFFTTQKSSNNHE